MTTKVISITGDETLQEAIDLMDRHNISAACLSPMLKTCSSVLSQIRISFTIRKR